MLEYCKIVLNGVREDKSLFRKELIKCMAWLQTQEQTQLKTWIKDNFCHQHADVINEILFTKHEFAS